MTKLIQRGIWATEMVHTNDHHRLLWITRGQGRVTLGAKNYGYRPFSAIFIPAGLSHSFEVRASCFGWTVDIESQGELVMPERPMMLRLADIADQRHFAKTIEALQSERKHISTDTPDVLTARALRYQAGLLGVWLERAAQKQKITESRTPAERLVERYLDVLESRLGMGDNVAALADLMEVTPTHLTRCCRKTLGKSALEVLNERLNYQARALLCTSGLAVKQIAHELGFASAAYFTRAFQNLADMTPSEFRAAQSRI